MNARRRPPRAPPPKLGAGLPPSRGIAPFLQVGSETVDGRARRTEIGPQFAPGQIADARPSAAPTSPPLQHFGDGRERDAGGALPQDLALELDQDFAPQHAHDLAPEAEQGIAFGMHLSVMCSEDGARMDVAAAARNDRGTALGDYRVRQLVGACREWVLGEPPRGHGKPVVSDVPALLVSGTLDPNTNETWGEAGLRGLSRGTHVVIPNLSHGFSSIDECGSAFMAQFIEQASMEGVDVSCKDRLKLPPFPLPVQ